MIHIDLDLARLQFTDTAKRYVDAKKETIIATEGGRRFTIVGTAGEAQVYIVNSANMLAPAQIHNEAAFVYSYGVRYDPNDWTHLSITIGRDLEPTQFHDGPNHDQFVRFDASFQLI